MTTQDDAAPLAGRRVLVVEDQYYVADEMCRAVQALGGEVVGPANSVSRALALIADGLPDLAVLDVNLNGARSYPLADALREQGVPFVFATGYEDWAVDPRYADIDVLEKPVATASLAAALTRLTLSQKGAER